MKAVCDGLDNQLNIEDVRCKVYVYIPLSNSFPFSLMCRWSEYLQEKFEENANRFRKGEKVAAFTSATSKYY